MIGSFLTRALILALGYAYPAYDCYKTVELNKPEIEKLRFWCQYWILVALLTVCERVADNFISWLPMYSEAKLAFIVYLWYPKTKGTTYVYDTFFRPYVAKHETEIDRNLLELRTRASDITVLYFQRVASYGQTRFFEILQYVASQSQAPRTRMVQRRQPPEVRQQPPAEPPAHPPSSSPQQQQPTAPPPPPGPTRNLMQEQPSIAAAPAHPQASSNPTRTLPSTSGPASLSSASEEPMQVDNTDNPSANGELQSPASEETVLEEAIRVTRARLRKRAAAAAPSTQPSSH
ncbi:putative HVA22-like protein g isoform X2 [Ananas comosus]|uniref:HVA22-like protein n=2 Tax=Ananas comosus TaxID=4615 RepID=A0A199VK50_ANACO|nr:putative HVA22-like protein g isoform X2 [Ananas comosus]OAY77383.1 HVA22-like protein i [Ananas comosus]CAD1821353.1 unnamed protein product [Ananas comosus var. bracteatus]